MKAIWKGSLSFGLVNIPVKMYSASQNNTLDLDMLRKDDHCQISFKRVCRQDGKEVPYKDIVRGYEYKDGDYIELTKEDFEAANVEKTSSIEIVQFSDKNEIDSIYYEKPYFLEPDKSSAKSYALLREALKESGKVGIARFVMKNREHIGVVRVHEDSIILNQIRFRDEVRKTDDLDLPAAKNVSDRELKMALGLIKHMEDKFNPKDFKDTYVDELKKIIQQKAKGHKVKPKGKAPKPTTAKNLMKLLKQSLDEAA